MRYRLGAVASEASANGTTAKRTPARSTKRTRKRRADTAATYRMGDERGMRWGLHYAEAGLAFRPHISPGADNPAVGDQAVPAGHNRGFPKGIHHVATPGPP